MKYIIIMSMFICQVGFAMWNTNTVKDPLADKGIDVEIVYTGEVVSNLSGGIDEDTSYLANVDLTLQVDTEKAGLWNNGTFFVYGLNNHRSGDLPTETFIGDLQTVSNIEAPNEFRLYELWYEH